VQVRKRLSQLGIQRGVTCVYSTEPPLAPLAPLTAEQEAAVLARKAACRAAAEADEPDGEGIGELTAEKKPIQTVFVFDDEHVLAGIAFRLFSSWCSTDLQCWWPYCSLTGGAPHAAPSKHATNACYHWQCRRSCGPYPNSVDMTATLDRGDISSFLYASRLPVPQVIMRICGFEHQNAHAAATPAAPRWRCIAADAARREESLCRTLAARAAASAESSFTAAACELHTEWL